jgi:opacity protein-like surface antigen
MTRLFSILISLIICLKALGQHELGIKLNGGLSKIKANRNISLTSSKFIFSPSGQGGIFYNLNLGKKSLIGVEFLFSQIESKEETKMLSTDNFGNINGEYGKINYDYHISYFSIPVYYGLKVKNMIINLGVQTSFAIASRGHWIVREDFNGIILTFEDESKINIDSYDFGPRAGVIFNLYKRFGIEATYYYGINNIMSSTAPPEWNWKIQQFTLGLCYKFLFFTKKEKPIEDKK